LVSWTTAEATPDVIAAPAPSAPDPVDAKQQMATMHPAVKQSWFRRLGMPCARAIVAPVQWRKRTSLRPELLSACRVLQGQEADILIPPPTGVLWKTIELQRRSDPRVPPRSAAA
jgi:hypothetical protein